MGAIAVIALSGLSDAFDMPLGWRLWPEVQADPVMCVAAGVNDSGRGDVFGAMVSLIIS